jgi:hypothetical protein
VKRKSLLLLSVWLLLTCIAFATPAGAPVITQGAATSQATEDSAPAAAGGPNWHAMGIGMNDYVNALAIAPDGAVYAGGCFTRAGGTGASYVANWNGSSWSPLGQGTDSYVNALAVAPDGTLYAGGMFTKAGGSDASNIAKWNGSAWLPLGSGLNGPVNALAVAPDGTVYAGGQFTQAGETSANYVARWDGFNWSALGPGMECPVHALATTPDGALYAQAGTSIGGASYVAGWNGSAWSILATPDDNLSVSTLAVTPDGTLYAGGNFPELTSEGMIKWDGSSWAPPGPAVSDTAVLQCLIAAPGGGLYGGGYFSGPYGAGWNCVSMWNGSSWTPVGSSPGNGSISALAMALEGALYAGGEFTQAGGAAAKYIAGHQTATAGSGSTQQTGSIQATISPQGAIQAGAQWNVDGGGWQASGATVSGLAVGSHSVGFKAVTGWNAPAALTVSIAKGQTKPVKGAYTQQTGFITGIIVGPPASAGARWAVDGGAWRNSGLKVSVPAGSHTVSFKPVNDWETPAAQTVTVTNGGNTEVTGTYIQPLFFNLSGSIGTVAQGSSFSYQIPAGSYGGGAGKPYSFSLGTGGGFPPMNITLCPTSGLLSGTDSSPPGVYTFSLCVTDAAATEKCTGSLTITVTNPSAPEAGNYSASCEAQGNSIQCCADGYCVTVPGFGPIDYSFKTTVPSGTTISKLTSQVCPTALSGMSAAGCVSPTCSISAFTDNSFTVSVSCTVPPVTGCTTETVSASCNATLQ